MKIFRFDTETGRPIDRFGSANVVQSKIARLTADAWVSCMHIGPGGVIGYHRATMPQLFLVVQGEGWVRGESPEQHAITVGRAAYWEEDEWHESGTESGMTAVVIEVESETFDPAEFMQES
jgi:quercetin dioxygenase-like cupin family protein